MKALLRLWLALTILTNAFGAGKPKNEAEDVSIVRLIAAPDRFVGKLVRVVGYLSIEFEGDAIYFHEEDFRRSLTANALYVYAEPDMMKELKKLTRQYVLIEGIFDPSDKGHMGLFSGAIKTINRADAWKFNAISAGHD